MKMLFRLVVKVMMVVIMVSFWFLLSLVVDGLGWGVFMMVWWCGVGCGWCIFCSWVFLRWGRSC